MVPVFKNDRERSMAKNYHTVSLLSVVLNDRLVNHLEKCGLLSNFQYGFRSS